ncbi:MAG TPA: MBL fold metallo-hydrolase [Azospirillum sp.]|nr:MBL fold metallo-hydrolase [Azospirillum sp.]
MPPYPVSDHCDGRRFRNVHASTDKRLKDVLRFWRSRNEWTPWPERVDDPPCPPLPAAAPDGHAALTFIGHVTFLIRVGGCTLLTDPVWSPHAGPLGRLGPKRARPPALALAELPPLDAVLVSHGHYDHMDLPTLKRLSGTPVVAGLGNKPFLERRGVRPVHELDWWQSVELGGARITFVPAQHWSSRTLFDRNTTLWGGFVVESGGACVYFCGDAGYSPHFREIAARFPRIDVALLPIGAYEPRWFMTPQHMNPDEAVRAHRDLGARASVAMHFGTFRLTPEGIAEPVAALGRARASHGVDEATFRVPGFGETLVLAAG